MHTAAMNKKLILQQRQEAYGHSDSGKIVTETQVYGAVRQPSLSFKSNLSSLGLDVSLTALLWRSEFEKAPYTHSVIDGVEYRISSVGAGMNDLFVSVVLVRA